MGVSKYNFTDDDKQYIKQLHNEGKYDREIAEIFNVSRNTISRFLQKCEDVESRHPLLTPEREMAIVNLYNSGLSQNNISNKMNTSSSTIKMILNKYGVCQREMSDIKTIYTLNKYYFDNIDSDDKAYILGLLYADGTVSKSSNNISISLQYCDRHILDEINSKLESNRELKLVTYSGENIKDQYRLTICNKHMKESLLKWGLIPNKSLILEFPNNLDKNLYPAFLLGYMDGDGHISKCDCRCNLVSTESFCNTVKKIIKNTLDVNCSIMYCHNRRDVSTRVLSIAGRNQVKKYLDWLYSNCAMHLDRKYEIYKKIYLDNTLSA